MKLIGVETKTALPPEAEDIVFGQHPDQGAEVKAIFLVWPDAEASIVTIKDKKCKITEIVDAGSGQPLKLKAEFGKFPKAAKDGKVAAHSVEFQLPEDPGSGRLKMSGVLTVVSAKGVKTEKIDNVSLAENAKLKAGDFELKVEGLKEKEGETDFRIESTKSMAAIKAVRFLRPDGTVIESQQGGRSWMSGFGGYSESWSFEIKGEAKDLTIEFDIHQNMADQEIPFDFVLPTSL
ncbi:MAG: hypothetical protein ACKO2G_12760 [Verrucomicrobiales bacterium]